MENQTTQNNNKCQELTKLSLEVEFIKKRHFFKISGWIYLASFAIFSIPTVISWWFMLKQSIAMQGILNVLYLNIPRLSKNFLQVFWSAGIIKRSDTNINVRQFSMRS